MDPGEIEDRLRKGPLEVFKVGRTTGVTRGRLRGVNTTPVPIKIGAKNYLYENLGYITPLEASVPFSKPGDSGALVYSKDGKAVGFVVGGCRKGGTMIHMAYSCLRAMRAELI